MSGKFLKARQLAKEMEEKAKKTAEEKKKASESLDRAEELLEFSYELGVDVSEAKELIDSAREKIDDREWNEGLEDVEKAIEVLETSLFEGIEEILEGAKEIHELIGNEDKYQESKELVEKARELAEEKDFKGAMETAEEALKLSSLEIEDKLTDDVVSMESLIMILEDKEKDTRGVKELISKIREAIDDTNFIQAATLVDGGMEKLNTDTQEFMNDRIEQLEKLEKIVRESGEKTTEVEKIISKLKVSAKKLDFEDSLELIKNAQNELDKSLEDVVESKFKEIKTSMEDAKEIEADLDQVNSLLDVARKMYTDEHFSEAYNILEDAVEKLEESKFHKVLKTIAESRENFIKAKDIGIDISEPMGLLTKARDELKEGNHKGALEWARAGRSKVKELVKDHDETESRIERSRNLIDELSDMNIDLEGADELISEAESSFSNKEYESAMAKLDEFDEYADKVAYEKIMSLIEELEMNMLIGEQMGLDVAEYTEKLEQSIAQTKSGVYAEAGKIAIENTRELKELIDEEINKRYENINDIIEKIKKEAGPEEDLSELDEIKEQIDDIEETIDKEMYRHAFDTIVNISEKLENWHVGEADGVLGKAEELVELVEKLEIEEVDIDGYKTSLEEAIKALENEDYSSSIQTSTNIISELNNRLRKTSEENFSEAKMEVVKAKKAGVAIEELRRKLIDCKKYIRSETYTDAIKLSMKIKEQARFLREKRKSSYDMISNISNELTRLRREESITDVGSAKQILLNAKDSFQNRDYVQAEKLAEQAMLKIEELHGIYDYESEAEGFKNIIAEAEAIGLDTTEAENVLEVSIRNANRGEFDIASENIKKAREKLTKEVEEYVKPEIERTRDIIKSAKNINIDISRPERKLKDAQALWQKKDFRGTIEKIEECRNDLEDIRNESRKAASEVKRVKERLVEAKDLNADLTEAERLLSTAMDALKKDKYAVAIKEAIRAEKSIASAEKERVEKLLSAFEVKIGDIRRQGVNTALADNLLRRAEKAKNQGDYKESINLAMQSEGELERIELQQDISKRSISATEGKLKSAKEKGIDVEDADKLLRQAKQAYKAGFYVKAFDNAVKSGDTLNKIVKAYENVSELLETLENAISAGECAGWDVEDLKDEFNSAKKDFQRGQYVKALMSARKAEQNLLSFEEYIPDIQKETESLAAKMERVGMDIGESKELLKQARLSFGMGDIIESIILIMNAKDEIGGEEFDEYNRFITEVVSLLASAHKFGADIGEVEKLVEEAKSLEVDDIKRARDKAEEALKEIEKTLEPYSPKLEISIQGRVDPESWSKVKVVLKNIGNGVGKSPKLYFEGCEYKDVELKDMLTAGEEETVEVELKPTDNKVVIKGGVTRVFDQKQVEDTVEIEPKIGEFEVKKSPGGVKCNVCKGNIKKGLDMIECECGATYHKTCGERGKECKECGIKFTTKKKASKRVALKI